MGENQQILAMKGHMKDMVDAMRADNAEACFEILTSQFETLRQLYKIETLMADAGFHETPAEPGVTSEESCAVLEQPVAQEPIPADCDERTVANAEPERTPARKMYRVERQLKGATVPEIGGYIPEIVLRDKGIEHGDWVYAEPILSHKPGQKRYAYELAAKAENPEPTDRVEYRGCPVERDVWMLVVSKSSSTGEKIRVNGAPCAIKIRDYDLYQFDLREGDVVDIAFRRGKPDTATVVWKHDIPAVGGFSKKPERKRSGKAKPVAVQNDVANLFDGKTICIAGDKPNEAGYRSLIEERGGTLLHIEPRWAKSRIDNIVKKADAVVGLYDVSKHTGLEAVKASCKAHGVPYEMIPGRGKTRVIQTAIQLLDAPVMS